MLSTLRTTGLCSLIVLHGCAVLYRNLRVANNYLFIMKIYNLLFSSIQGDHDVYLFGQDHFIRKKPKEDTHMTNGRYYDFTDIMKNGSRFLKVLYHILQRISFIRQIYLKIS